MKNSIGTQMSPPKKPFHLVWLATNLCNAKCIHCSSSSGRRNTNELNTTEAKDMFVTIAQMGVLDVAISGGEPLLRKDIFYVMEHASSLGIRLGLGSNGSTITTKRAWQLKTLGLHRLQISIDGIEKTHDAARCWTGLYQKAVRAIQVSLDCGLRTHVCCTVHRLNYHELPEIFDICASWGVHRLNISRFVPTGRGDIALDLSPDKWRDVVAVCETKEKEYEGRLEVTTHLAQMILTKPELACHPGFAGCQAGRGQGCISSEGEVMPCVVLPIVIGNIRNAPLEDIWSMSPVIRNLQSRSTLIGPCGTCHFQETCGGCRAVAYSYTGDYRSSDPRCWLNLNTDRMDAIPSSPPDQIYYRLTDC